MAVSYSMAEMVEMVEKQMVEEQEQHGGHSHCSRFPNCNQKTLRPGRRRRTIRHWQRYRHSHRTNLCTALRMSR